jgi:type I restriction enzyme R subunit
LKPYRKPLPFYYQSTGVETRFTNLMEPDARSRSVFSFHRPETLAEWIMQEAKNPGSTLRARLKHLPPFDERNLWSAQTRAIKGLEQSLGASRPRALIQMATGSGKTFTACNFCYRLIKHAGAKRILFLVDRRTLGIQARDEFQKFVTPEENRKFTELYNVQHLQSNKLDPVAKVSITTIQRLYAMLRGEPDLNPGLDETSLATLAGLYKDPLPVVYNPGIPIETFDFVVIDECHRSIYNLWRQVLEYFDAFLIGLTATPSKQTLGFFNQNLVMEHNHEQAVADKVNVGFDVYRIRTYISEHGSSVDAGLYIDKRDRQTRKIRWEKLDEDFSYPASQLDRDVVAKDQIRTVIKTFGDKLFTEIFPGRREVPKTLIFAKDDSHAEDIVNILREEFGKGNDFAQKITYKSGVVRIPVKRKLPDGAEVDDFEYKTGGITAEQRLKDFRNSYNPRVAVTVDMIATGTDVKPIECVMFMRDVKSRTLFEQMKGRGSRVIKEDDLRAVTPDATSKTHFIIVDAIGICESELVDTHPLEKKPSVSFEKLLEFVAQGSRDKEVLSSLASRLARLSLQLTKEDQKTLTEFAGGRTLSDIAGEIVRALDPDQQVEAAQSSTGWLCHEKPEKGGSKVRRLHRQLKKSRRCRAKATALQGQMKRKRPSSRWGRKERQRRTGHARSMGAWWLAMQPVPEDAEEVAQSVADGGGYADEQDGDADAERADDVDGLDEMEPEDEVNDRLRPAERDQGSPQKMPTAHQCSEDEACFVRVDGNHGELLLRRG